MYKIIRTPILLIAGIIIFPFYILVLLWECEDYNKFKKEFNKTLYEDKNICIWFK